ncbi:MAG: sigma 54-interacting transcriptional regulator [Candidatus Thiodiazotropha endolucinida]
MPSQRPVVVVVEDDEMPRGRILRKLSGIGIDLPEDTHHLVSSADGIKAVNKYYNRGSLLAVITDLNLAEDEDNYSGWKIVDEVYRLSPTLPVAVVSGYLGVDPVSLRLQSGALKGSFRTFQKNANYLDELIDWIEKHKERRDSQLSLSISDAKTSDIYNKIAPVYANSNLPILIVGESGTGKESLARHVHNQSGRTGPFIPINCGGLEDSLAFAELFGHQQGAFTDAINNDLGHVLRASGYNSPLVSSEKKEQFERWLQKGNSDLKRTQDNTGETILESEEAEKNAGTLFLDEVGTISTKAMGGLLRFLSSSVVHPVGYRGFGIKTYCRIIAASNELQRLTGTSGDGSTPFRSDLYHRLAGAVLELPPLAERDPVVFADFVQNPKIWDEFSMERIECSPDSIDWITALYQGREGRIASEMRQGNFRTLKHLLHRAALLALADKSTLLEPSHFELALEHSAVVTEPNEENDNSPYEGSNEFDHIRETFQSAYGKCAKPIYTRVSSKLVQELSAHDAPSVAAACLECLSIERLNFSSRLPYYQQRDVELALTGVDTRKLFSKWLRVGDAKIGASKYFKVKEEELGNANQMSQVVELVRKSRRESGISIL